MSTLCWERGCEGEFSKTNFQPKEWERCFTLGCQTRQKEMTIQSLGMRRSRIGNWYLIIQFKHAQHTNVCQIFHTNSTDDPSNSWKAYTEEEMEETTLRSTWSSTKWKHMLCSGTLQTQTTQLRNWGNWPRQHLWENRTFLLLTVFTRYIVTS